MDTSRHTSGKRLDALNRGLGRHHVAAAMIALAVSLLIHGALLARIETLPLRPPSPGERQRFTPIEMVDVRRDPPPREDTLERPPLDRPGIEIPAEPMEEDVWTDWSPPAPLTAPWPEPPAPLAPETQREEPAVAAWRQDVMAIADPLFSEEESALPRRWDEAGIPRMDQAPDIQLPVNLTEDIETKGVFDPAAVARWLSDPEAGTPDWGSVMAGRVAGGGTAGPGEAVKPLRQSDTTRFDERADEVSALEAIDDLVTIRVLGHRAPDGYLYFALHVEPVADQILAVQPRDIVFVQDSSGSMTPAKINESRRGLKRWLDFLNPGDRFEIVAFSDDINPCFGGWREYTPESRREGFLFLDRLRAVGNTDIFRSLQMALEAERDPARTMLMVLISDGRPTVGVTGSSDIIEGITRGNQGRVSIFSVGGGNKVNSFFLDLLSYRNRGEAVVVKGDDEIPRAMEDWARQLRRPVLTDLSYQFSRVDTTEIYPKQLTHLFLDRPLVIHGRVPDRAEPIVFQVVGRTGTNWHDFVFAIAPDDIVQGPAALRSGWAWQKVYHMIGDYLGGPTPERLEEIQAFAERYQLLVPYGFSRALPRRM